MKHLFVLVQLVAGCGLFAAAAAHLTTPLPFDVSDIATVVGVYTVACVLAIMVDDYTRDFRRCLPPAPPPAPVAQRPLAPKPRPVPSPVPSAMAAFSCHTISG